MKQRVRFDYSARPGLDVSAMPRLNLTLHLGRRSIDVIGLVDSGSSVNVLPYSIGTVLGAVWAEQKPVEPLGGNLQRSEARGLLLQASHPQLTSGEKVGLVFAWIQSEDAPVIFGQMNFFRIFEICFFAAENAFEVQQR